MKIPIANRIARAASSGRFGNIIGGGSDEITIAPGDCFALDSAKYKASKWDGKRVGPTGKETRTVEVFVSHLSRRSY